MTAPAFHPDDVSAARAPSEAFDLASPSTPSVYALQNHLALEVVAHLGQSGVPFHFRGGTALHTKLPSRRRFSIDVDIVTSARADIHAALVAFAERFPRSGVKLREPPAALLVDGVRHTLDFEHTGTDGSAPVRILVEVVEAKLDNFETEPLAIRCDGHDWAATVRAPTLNGFTGQKLAVLGPNTIGKKVGLNELYARSNQGVSKQIFDLRELLLQGLDVSSVRNAYEAAVDEANRLRRSSHSVAACLQDAADLLRILRRPATKEKQEEMRYGLWSGHRESSRWIAEGARSDWTSRHYRIAGGCIARLTESLVDQDVEFDRIRRPLSAGAPPAEIMNLLSDAQADGADWFSDEDFGADALLAWAWAPRSLW